MCLPLLGPTLGFLIVTSMSQPLVIEHPNIVVVGSNPVHHQRVSVFIQGATIAFLLNKNYC